jgi:hypothetical protein
VKAVEAPAPNRRFLAVSPNTEPVVRGPARRTGEAGRLAGSLPALPAPGEALPLFS